MAGDDPAALATAIGIRNNAASAALSGFTPIVKDLTQRLGFEMNKTPYGNSSDVDDIVASKLGKGK